jgi:hypothetical protein
MANRPPARPQVDCSRFDDAELLQAGNQTAARDRGLPRRVQKGLGATPAEIRVDHVNHAGNTQSRAPATLLCLSSRQWRSVFDEAVEAAREVALEAAICFASGLAFAEMSFDVGDRRRV